MKKAYIIIIGLLLFCVSTINAQKYFTRNGEVSFYSQAPMEDIKAFNKQASCIINVETGEIVSKVLIKSFEFKKALMQEHFNENYMESDKYPKAILKAKIKNFNKIDFNKKEEQNIILEGTFEIHGQKKKQMINAKIKNIDNNIEAKAKFIIKLKDYKIEIPKAVVNNIAERIEVTVSFKLSKL